MAEKVATVGIRRDADFMYYIKDGAVWRVPRKAPGLAKGRPEQVVDAGIKQDTAFIYFLDRDGDVSRARRAIGGMPDVEKNEPDEDEEDIEEDTDTRELLYKVCPDLDVSKATINIVGVREECQRLFDEVRSLAELKGLTPRQFEQLLAETFRREGYEAYLTPATRDGGRDVIAVLPGPLPVLIVAEAKHMALVPPAAVHSLVAVRDRDRAHMGLIATTGRFSIDTRVETEAHWRRWITLRDGEEFIAWLARLRNKQKTISV